MKTNQKLTALQTGPLGVNTWIVPLAGSCVLIVDPAACALTGDQNRITDYLSERELIPVGILLTHGHFDHVPGLPFLKQKFPYIKIAIHQKDAASIGANSFVHHSQVLGAMSYYDEPLLESVTHLPEADFLFKGNESLDKVFDEEYLKAVLSEKTSAGTSADELMQKLSEWKVLHTPGHSEGSVCFYNASEKTLICGDTIFYHSYGRTDLTGGSEAVIRKSLVQIYETLPEDTLVYPGHDYSGFPLSENK